jgi:hypothetical protein
LRSFEVVVIDRGRGGEAAAGRLTVSEAPVERLRHALPRFPRRSEIWLSLPDQAGVCSRNRRNFGRA